MACACRGRSTKNYVWTSEPDDAGAVQTMTYTTEVQARAKVIRNGGSYATVEK